MTDVLLICADPENVDHLLALASTSEIRVDVSAQIAAASARWSHAGVVVVGVDQLREVAAAGLPRRCGVVDLIMAVAIGVIIKSLITARRLATHQIEDVLFMSAVGKSGRRHALSEREEALLDKAGDALLLLRFTGPLSFGTARDLSSRLHTAYEDYRALVVDLSDTRMMDASIMMTLADMIERAREQGVCIYVGGVDNPVYGMLKSHGALDGVEDAHMFVQREDALVAAVEAL